MPCGSDISRRISIYGPISVMRVGQLVVIDLLYALPYFMNCLLRVMAFTALFDFWKLVYNIPTFAVVYLVSTVFFIFRNHCLHQSG